MKKYTVPVLEVVARVPTSKPRWDERHTKHTFVRLKRAALCVRNGLPLHNLWAANEVAGVVRASGPLVVGNVWVWTQRARSQHSRVCPAASMHGEWQGLRHVTLRHPIDERVEERSGVGTAVRNTWSHEQTCELLNLVKAAANGGGHFVIIIHTALRHDKLICPPVPPASTYAVRSCRRIINVAVERAGDAHDQLATSIASAPNIHLDSTQQVRNAAGRDFRTHRNGFRSALSVPIIGSIILTVLSKKAA